MAMRKWFGNAASHNTSGHATGGAKALPISGPDCKRFGLENFGNTCYANSVLQALYFCHPFRDLVIQSPDSSNPISFVNAAPTVSSPPVHPPAPQRTKSSKKVPTTDSKSSVDNALTNGAVPTGPIIPSIPPTLFSALRSLYVHIANNSLEKGVVSPRAFIEKLKKENELFRSTMHQDAHEFLNYLLNKVAEDLSEEEKNQSRGSSKEDLTKSTATVASSSTTQGSSSTSFVQDLFEGVLTSETRCLTCESLSSRDEAFLDLSIDIEQNSSVTACLRQFSASEMLCQKNKFFCDSCCGLQEAERRMKIKKLPNVLALHLKRFKYQEDVQKYIKLAYRVAFPLELRLFNTADDAKNPDRLYELFAIVVHIGNGPHHGHYVAIVKSMGSWLVFDDDSVETIKESDMPKYFGDNVGSGSAYVLYYQAADLNETALGIKHSEAGTTVESLPVSTSPAMATPVLPPGLSIEDADVDVRLNGHAFEPLPAPAVAAPAPAYPYSIPPTSSPVVAVTTPPPAPSSPSEPFPMSPPIPIISSKSFSPSLSLAISNKPNSPSSAAPVQTLNPTAAAHPTIPTPSVNGIASPTTSRSGPSSFFNTLRHSSSVRAVSNAAASVTNRQSLYSSTPASTTISSPSLSKPTVEPIMSPTAETSSGPTEPLSQPVHQPLVNGKRQIVKERSTGWFTKRRSLKMDAEQGVPSSSGINLQGMATSAAEARSLSSGKVFRRPSTSGGAVNGHRKYASTFESVDHAKEMREEELQQPPGLNLRHGDSPASVSSSLQSDSAASTAPVSFPSSRVTPEPRLSTISPLSPSLPAIPASPQRSSDHKKSQPIKSNSSPMRRKSERIPPRPSTASGKLSSHSPSSDSTFPVPPIPTIRNGASLERERHDGSLDSHSSSRPMSSFVPSSPPPPSAAANKRPPRKLSFTGGMLGFGRKDKERHKEKDASLLSTNANFPVSVDRL